MSQIIEIKVPDIGDFKDVPIIDIAVKAGDTVVCFGDSLTFGSGVKGAGTTEGEAYPAVLRRLFEQRGRTAPGTPYFASIRRKRSPCWETSRGPRASRSDEIIRSENCRKLCWNTACPWSRLMIAGS